MANLRFAAVRHCHYGENQRRSRSLRNSHELTLTGRIVSRTELTEKIYSQDHERDSNTIEVFIGILRRKIGTDRIITEKGLGYRLVDPAEQQ